MLQTILQLHHIIIYQFSASQVVPATLSINSIAVSNNTNNYTSGDYTIYEFRNTATSLNSGTVNTGDNSFNGGSGGTNTGSGGGGGHYSGGSGGSGIVIIAVLTSELT
jgi:uncharacterized membrane protein YgcG